MSNAEKMTEMVKENPELQQKVGEEIRRLLESGEAADAKSAFIAATRNILGIEFTESELDGPFSQIRELSPEELDQAAGGFSFTNVLNMTLIAAAGGGTVLGGAGLLMGGVVGAAVGGIVGSAAGGIAGLTMGTITEIVKDHCT